MAYKELNVLFCGARWLGMECLKKLTNINGVNLVGAVVPRKTEKVWWTDVVEEDCVNKLGIPLLSWSEARELDDLDLVFSVLHGEIFKKPMIDKVKYGVINLHPAALPYYRGCNSYAHAIMNGEKEYGITLHYVDEGIDTGPIIDQEWLDILPEDTGKTLYLRTQKVARDVFYRTIPRIILHAFNGERIRAVSQDDSMAKYYPRTSLNDKQADLSWSYRQLYDFVRALDFPPFDPAYGMFDGIKYDLSIKNGSLILDSDFILSGRQQNVHRNEYMGSRRA